MKYRQRVSYKKQGQMNNKLSNAGLKKYIYINLIFFFKINNKNFKISIRFALLTGISIIREYSFKTLFLTKCIMNTIY